MRRCRQGKWERGVWASHRTPARRASLPSGLGGMSTASIESPPTRLAIVMMVPELRKCGVGPPGGRGGAPSHLGRNEPWRPGAGPHSPEARIL